MSRLSIYPVILAGGSGTRFWPLSRSAQPKQFLKIFGSRSLLDETIRRLQPLAHPKNIFLVSSRSHRTDILAHTDKQKIPRSNILFEPAGKNTAPAVYWAALEIYRQNPDGIIAVFPSDHVLLNPKAFQRLFRQAVSAAKENDLVTVGIVPTRPETGYGYIQFKNKQHGRIGCRVEQFTEKPSLDKAKRFVASKKYLWNSGMFFFKCSTILKSYRRFLPQICRSVPLTASRSRIERAWPRLPSISIDYGILEKAENVIVIPAKNLGWSDLGSWESLADVLAYGRTDNIVHGNVLQKDCAGSLIWAGKRLVAAVGLNNVVIVDTPDALLVCRKNASQNVRQIVETLKAKKLHRYL